MGNECFKYYEENAYFFQRKLKIVNQECSFVKYEAKMRNLIQCKIYENCTSFVKCSRLSLSCEYHDVIIVIL